MPAQSASQQRLFEMVHAYQKGKLKHPSGKIEEIAKHISEEDAEHFAKTKHDNLPERKQKLKKVAEFVGSLYKKADPPNRGLNDPNTLKRYVYRHYGYVPQSPASYLYSGDSTDYNRMVDEVNRLAPLAWDEHTPEYQAATFDLDRAAGNVESYHMLAGEDPDGFGRHATVIGSYPWSNRKVLAHELGHHVDDQWEQRYANNGVLDGELAAWENSGVPAGDPLREAALDTYRAKALADDDDADDNYASALEDQQNRYYALMPRGYKEPKWAAPKTVWDMAMDKATRMTANEYERPEQYIKSVPNPDKVPVIHDYNSALDAGRKAQALRNSTPAPMVVTAEARKKESYVEGEGKVESYTPDKTKNHDEIVVRLKDGRTIRISNNTVLGKRLKATTGSRISYHGYKVEGTDVVHKTHSNAHSRGGWLETKNTEKTAAEKQQVLVYDGKKTYIFPSPKAAATFIAGHADGVSVSDVQKMLYSRATDILGFKIGYPESGDAGGVPASDAPTGSDTALKLTGTYSPSSYGG